MSFEPVIWQNPHAKFLDKWQLGDVNRDDMLDWAMWLDTLPVKDDRLNLVVALVFEEDDDFLLLQQIKILINELCDSFALEKPQYDFGDNHYGIEMTNPFYHQLLPMINSEQLSFIAKLDYEHDIDKNLEALSKVIFEQNGIIDFNIQRSWHPHEVVSLGHWSCIKQFELSFVLCNCILARTVLSGNDLADDGDYLKIDDSLEYRLLTILNYHVHYAQRLSNAKENSTLFWLNR